MAPQKGGQAGKQVSSAQGNAKQQQQQQQPKKPVAAPRPMVQPAIPLPYMQRRVSAAPFAASSNSNNRNPVASLEAALIDHHQPANPNTPRKKTNQRHEVNGGSNVEKAGINHCATDARANSNGHNSSQQQYHSGMNGTVNGSNGFNSIINEAVNGVYGVSGPYELAASSTQVSTAPSIAGDYEPTMASTTSQPQSATMPTFRSDFLPPFHGPPSGHAHHPAGPPNLHNRNGLVFGGMGTESHTPSPALNGAFIPPPIHMNGHDPRMNGHHAHTDSNGTDFPMDSPYLTSSTDAYGQIPVHAPGPRQMPMPFGHRPNSHNHSNNSHPGPQGHPSHFQPFLDPEFSRRASMIDDGAFELIHYLQNLLATSENSDCILELVYVDGRKPFKINGHKLIFSRIPTLRSHLEQTEAHLRATGQTTDCTVTFTLDDQFLRSDAWFEAVRRLYAFPLLCAPMSHNNHNIEYAGSAIEQFKYCIGYAAAGFHLQMIDVLMRGLLLASNNINWDTVEEGLSFALDGVSYFHVEGQGEGQTFAYGPEMEHFMGALLKFLHVSFPANFELDTTAVDPPKFARLPSVPLESSPVEQMAPAIARGTSKSAKTRLSSIKFGDLPTAFPEDDSVPREEPAPCSPQLSRILLNLPFNELRAVLTPEHDQGWHTAHDRYYIANDIIIERESRRTRAVDAVRKGMVSGYNEIQQRLSSSTPYAAEDPWDRLNWMEELVQPGAGTGAPRIVRTWAPQFADPFAMPVKPSTEERNMESMV